MIVISMTWFVAFILEVNLYRFSLSLAYICIALEIQLIRGTVWIQLTGFTPSHFCACPKQGHGFPTSYVVVFFCVQWVKVRGDCSVSEGERWLFSEWRWEVIVHFVDIVGIVDHHCLKFIFITLLNLIDIYLIVTYIYLIVAYIYLIVTYIYLIVTYIYLIVTYIYLIVTYIYLIVTYVYLIVTYY